MLRSETGVGVESSWGPSDPNVSMMHASLWELIMSLLCLKSVFLGFNLFLEKKLSSEDVCRKQNENRYEIELIGYSEDESGC